MALQIKDTSVIQMKWFYICLCKVLRNMATYIYIADDNVILILD